MTYQLNPEVIIINSPIVLILPGGERLSYPNGNALAEACFEERYRLMGIYAYDGTIEIKVEVMETPNINPAGEQVYNE